MPVSPTYRWKRVDGGFVGWAECPCGVITRMPADRCSGCGQVFKSIVVGSRRVIGRYRDPLREILDSQ